MTIEDPTRRSYGRPAIRAALAGLALLFSACGSDAQVAAKPATTTSSALADDPSTTTTSAPESTTTTVSPTDAWDDLPGWSAAVSGGPASFFGEVRALSFSPVFSFVAPDGTGKSCPSVSDFIDVIPATAVPDDPLRNQAPAELNVFRRTESTVEETAQAIVASMNPSAEVLPTEIGGAEGVTFDADTPAGDSVTLFISSSGACTLTSKKGETWRFWIVDVEGDVVTMAFYSPIDELATHLPVVEEILDSFTWRALS